MTAFIIPIWVHIVAQLATTLYVFIFGGRDERLGSGYLVVNTLVIAALYRFHITHITPDIIVEPFDVVAFGFILLRSNRHWTIFATAVAILEVLINIIYTVAVDIRYYGVIVGNWAYMSAQIILFYALLATLIYATWSGRRRKSGLAAFERSSPRDAAA
jgi:hypothetical protein